MTTIQLIYTDVNKAVRKLITTRELDEEFTRRIRAYKLPTAPTSKDFEKIDRQVLISMFVIKE
jgi:hypothetical protein